MALTPRLGVYEVTAPLGEGGMGQVWRATDTTLGRQVAIKILPDAFAANPERLARFEREAKTLASLNHPNFAAIYAVGGTDGRAEARPYGDTRTEARSTLIQNWNPQGKKESRDLAWTTGKRTLTLKSAEATEPWPHSIGPGARRSRASPAK